MGVRRTAAAVQHWTSLRDFATSLVRWTAERSQVQIVFHSFSEDRWRNVYAAGQVRPAVGVCADNRYPRYPCGAFLGESPLRFGGIPSGQLYSALQKFI